MDIKSFNPFTPGAMLPPSRYLHTVCVALLLAAGAVHAAGAREEVAERPLNLSLPRDAKVLQEWRKTHEAEYLNKKPYGSGYEARGLGGAKNGGTDLSTSPSSGAVGSGNSGKGSTGGRGSGGGGGAGGRGR
jgi:hypothetical protein